MRIIATLSLLALAACATPAPQEVVIPATGAEPVVVVVPADPEDPNLTIGGKLPHELERQPTSWCEAYSWATPAEREKERKYREPNDRRRMQTAGFVIDEKSVHCWTAFEEAAAEAAIKHCTEPIDLPKFYEEIEKAGKAAEACYLKVYPSPGR